VFDNEFTSDQRDDVSQLMADVADRVMDDFMDSATPDSVYKYYAQLIKSMAQMVLDAQEQGGAGFDEATLERARRVVELFKNAKTAD